MAVAQELETAPPQQGLIHDVGKLEQTTRQERTQQQVLLDYYNDFIKQGKEREYAIAAAFTRYLGDLIANGFLGNEIIKALKLASLSTGRIVHDYCNGEEVIVYDNLDDIGKGEVPIVQLRIKTAMVTYGTTWYSRLVPESPPLRYNYRPPEEPTDFVADFRQKRDVGELRIVEGEQTGRFDPSNFDIIWNDQKVIGIKTIFPSGLPPPFTLKAPLTSSS